MTAEVSIPSLRLPTSRNANGAADLGALVGDLQASAGALAALAAALNARVTGERLDAALEPHVQQVLQTLGVDGVVERLAPLELAGMLGELRTLAATHQRLLMPTPPKPGWTPTDPVLLQAAGDASAALPQRIARSIAPTLEGLVARLDADGARFLDVGVGAAALSIQMAIAWPALQVVGLDPWPAALELARHAVRAAGLETRIELRERFAEQLDDAESFDLAWIPSLFVPPRALGAVIERVQRALRRGGWLLMPVMAPHDGRLAAGVARLRTALWGGSALELEPASNQLVAAGFADVRALPAAPTSLTRLVAARRAVGSAERVDRRS